MGLTELYYAGSHGMDIKFPLKDTGVNSEKLSDLQVCVISKIFCILCVHLWFYQLSYPTIYCVQDKEFSLFQPAREYLPMIEEVSIDLAILSYVESNM